MQGRLIGHDVDGQVERRWTLLACYGDGPEIPTPASLLVAERLVAGAVPPDVRNAGGLLDIADSRQLFAELAVDTHEEEHRLPPPLYIRVMGEAFDRSPSAPASAA